MRKWLTVHQTEFPVGQTWVKSQPIARGRQSLMTPAVPAIVLPPPALHIQEGALLCLDEHRHLIAALVAKKRVEDEANKTRLRLLQYQQIDRPRLIPVQP